MTFIRNIFRSGPSTTSTVAPKNTEPSNKPAEGSSGSKAAAQPDAVRGNLAKTAGRSGAAATSLKSRLPTAAPPTPSAKEAARTSALGKLSAHAVYQSSHEADSWNKSAMVGIRKEMKADAPGLAKRLDFVVQCRGILSLQHAENLKAAAEFRESSTSIKGQLDKAVGECNVSSERAAAASEMLLEYADSSPEDLGEEMPTMMASRFTEQIDPTLDADLAKYGKGEYSEKISE